MAQWTPGGARSGRRGRRRRQESGDGRDRVVRRRAEATGRADAQRRQPLLELLGRLAIEGEHEDARGVGAAVDELDDPAHQRLGLAGAGRGEDARRAAGVQDGGALRVVEPDGVGAARREALRRAGASAAGGLGGLPGASNARAAAVARSRRPMSSRSSSGGLADGEAARFEDVRAERKAQAERQAARNERVDEAQKDLRGLRLELLTRPLPVPEAGSRVVPKQGTPGLARVVGPDAPGGEAHARRRRRRQPGQLLAGRDPEEDEPRSATPSRGRLGDTDVG